MKIDNAEEPPILPIHEWMAVVAIIFLLCVLTALVFFTNSQESSPSLGKPHLVIDQEIEITIEGAVQNPGKHRLKRGATIQDALAVAQPTPEADLRKLKQSSKIRKGQVIKVPTVKMITVHIEGAVESSGTISLPKGTRVQDLIGKVQFRDNADLEKLRKKRYLRDGETIHVDSI